MCDVTDRDGRYLPFSTVDRGLGTFDKDRVLYDHLTRRGSSSREAYPSGTELNGVIRRGRLRFFSYGPPDPGGAATSRQYSPDDTRQSLAASAQRLGAQLEAWGLAEGRFDLIGHSLGGAVATTWAATETNAVRRQAVRSIITLDSPVNGMTSVLWYVGTWLQQGKPVSEELGSDTAQVRAMRASVSRMNVVTIGNTNDLLVDDNAALLAGGCPDFVAPCLINESGPDINHAAVLNSQTVRVWIDRVLMAAAARGEVRQNGQPAAGATVLLDGTQVAQTSSTGHFTFLAEGPYTTRQLTVRKDSVERTVAVTLTAGG